MMMLLQRCTRERFKCAGWGQQVQGCSSKQCLLIPESDVHVLGCFHARMEESCLVTSRGGIKAIKGHSRGTVDECRTHATPPLVCCGSRLLLSLVPGKDGISYSLYVPLTLLSSRSSCPSLWEERPHKLIEVNSPIAILVEELRTQAGTAEREDACY